MSTTTKRCSYLRPDCINDGRMIGGVWTCRIHEAETGDRDAAYRLALSVAIGSRTERRYTTTGNLRALAEEVIRLRGELMALATTPAPQGATTDTEE